MWTVATIRRAAIFLLYIPVLVYFFFQLRVMRDTFTQSRGTAHETDDSRALDAELLQMERLLNETKQLTQRSPPHPSLDTHTTTTDTNLTTSNATSRMIRGQLEDENMVEPELPPLEYLPPPTLNTSAARLFNDEATMAIPLTIGVLTAPGLLRSRLIPLLETSLRDERDVHVFFADTNVTEAGRAALHAYLVSVNRTHEVFIAAIPPLENMAMSIRNAWLNLPALLYFHAKRPTQRWFAIMDDDTYFLTNAIRRILRDAEVRPDLEGKPVYMGAPITDGLQGGCRVLRSGKTLRVQRTTTRKEVQFVCGGSGILLNHDAIDRLLKYNATVKMRMIDYCIQEMLQPAGDVRLGHCMSEALVPIVARREMFRDNVFVAIGEKEQYFKYAFPASFHRFRKREWQYAVRAVTDLRDKNELVTWGDLMKNFVPGPEYWRSFFYPKDYANYTEIMGIRVKTQKELIREKLIWKRFQCARKENTDLW